MSERVLTLDFFGAELDLLMQVELEETLREKDAQLERIAASGSVLRHDLGNHSLYNGAGPSMAFAVNSPPIMAHISPSVTPPMAASGLTNDINLNATTTVLWPNWPANLPSLDLLHHL